MEPEDLDDVLRRVATGELSPEDALAALGQAGDPAPAPDEPLAWPGDLDHDEEHGEEPGGEEGPAEPVSFEKVAPGQDMPDEPDDFDAASPDEEPAPAPEDGSGRLRVVRLRMPARAIDVFADPAVAEVHVSGGAPVLRRQGDTLVVEPASQRVGPGVRFAFTGSLPRRLASAASLLDERIVVRINPALRLDVDATAVSLRVWGCEGGLRLRLAASSCKLSRIAGPVHLDVMSSSVKGSARLTGQNRIRCESSSVKLSLMGGSDVRIQARNRMGKVVVPRRTSRAWPGEEGRTAGVVGRGRGRLTVDATMSSVLIGAPL